MRRKTKALRIVYPEEQRYACRDCPARCCQNWGIPVSLETAHQILSDETLKARLVGRGPTILATGTLPMVERDRHLKCVFLDDDLLCAVQKRGGHSALPSACQAYPFGFVKNEQGDALALLSQHCPSIRDNYGEPLARQIEQKLTEAGGPQPLAPRMGLRSGRTLPASQYLKVVNSWRDILSEGSPLFGVLRSYAITDAFDEALPPGSTPQGTDIERAIEQAQSTALATVPARKRPSWQARLFYAHVLGSLSYPSRVLRDYTAHRPPASRTWGAWGNKLSWLLGIGSVDLLHVPGPVSPRKVARIPSFLGGEHSRLVADYLVVVLERRQLFLRQTYLTRTLVDLGLMLALISRYARASAAGHGRAAVARADVKEAIGIADLVMAHRAHEARDTVLDNLRLALMSDPKAFTRFLASEA